jgi:predicted nucleic acid-binding protein
MNHYLLDTNILLYYLRREVEKTQMIDRLYAPFDPQNKIFLSIVTVAELHAIAMRHQWGDSRWRIVTHFLRKVVVIPIDSQDLIDRYAEIDTFSQGKLAGRPLLMSARNMGKNDIWIAASASILDLPLITNDADFSHLDPAFLTVHKVNFSMS